MWITPIDDESKILHASGSKRNMMFHRDKEECFQAFFLNPHDHLGFFKTSEEAMNALEEKERENSGS
jgi:hypothetical protein